MGDQEDDLQEQDDLHGAAVDDPNVPPPWAQAMFAQMAQGIGQAIGNAMQQHAQNAPNNAAPNNAAPNNAAPGHGNLANDLAAALAANPPPRPDPDPAYFPALPKIESLPDSVKFNASAPMAGSARAVAYRQVRSQLQQHLELWAVQASAQAEAAAAKFPIRGANQILDDDAERRTFCARVSEIVREMPDTMITATLTTAGFCPVRTNFPSQANGNFPALETVWNTFLVRVIDQLEEALFAHLRTVFVSNPEVSELLMSLQFVYHDKTANGHPNDWDGAVDIPPPTAKGTRALTLLNSRFAPPNPFEGLEAIIALTDFEANPTPDASYNLDHHKTLKLHVDQCYFDHATKSVDATRLDAHTKVARLFRSAQANPAIYDQLTLKLASRDPAISDPVQVEAIIRALSLRAGTAPAKPVDTMLAQVCTVCSSCIPEHANALAAPRPVLCTNCGATGKVIKAHPWYECPSPCRMDNCLAPPGRHEPACFRYPLLQRRKEQAPPTPTPSASGPPQRSKQPSDRRQDGRQRPPGRRAQQHRARLAEAYVACEGDIARIAAEQTKHLDQPETVAFLEKKLERVQLAADRIQAQMTEPVPDSSSDSGACSTTPAHGSLPCPVPPAPRPPEPEPAPYGPPRKCAHAMCPSQADPTLPWGSLCTECHPYGAWRDSCPACVEESVAPLAASPPTEAAPTDIPPSKMSGITCSRAIRYLPRDPYPSHAYHVCNLHSLSHGRCGVPSSR